MDIKKLIADFKKYNKPDNVKKRLKTQIEIEKLRLEKEKINAERKKNMAERWKIGEP